MKRKKKTTLEYFEEFANDMDDNQNENMKEEYGFPKENPVPLKRKAQILHAEMQDSVHHGNTARMKNYKEKDIENGNWVLIKENIPVSPDVKPVRWGLYWGVPLSVDGRDDYGRTGCKVFHAKETVTVFQDEYIIPNKETIKALKLEGWYVHEIGAMRLEPPNMEYIEKSRTLCEEEREIIWALQLDGLTEEQACMQYFEGRYTNRENVSICYLPPEGKGEMLTAMFGNIGKFELKRR